MSKIFKKFKSFVLEESVISKFFTTHKAGDRVVPANAPKENAKHELRFDAGEVKDGHRNLYLQVNSEATNSALKKFRSKHGTHAKVATTRIKVDVPKSKQKEELNKALEDTERQFRARVG